MYHLRLSKGMSYTNGIISATQSKPDVYTEDKATAETAVESGYFTLVGEVEIKDGIAIDDGAGEETAHLDKEQLEGMTVAELKKLATDMGIDVADCKVKADYVEAIAAVEVTPGAEVETGGEIDYSEE